MNKYLKIITNKRILIPIGISCLGLYLAFHDFNLDEFNNSLRSLNYYLVGVTCLSLIISVWLRAIRWKLLFRNGIEISTFNLFKNQLIGYFGNNILPLKFGEVIRSYLIGKEHNIASTYVFGTIINEKIMDMITLLLLFLLLFSIKTIEFSLYKYLIALLLAIVISVLIVALFIFFKEKISSKGFIRELINGMQSIECNQLHKFLLLSLSIWIIYWLNIYLVGMAFHFNLSLSDCLILLVIITTIISIPSAPGMIGTFHLASKYVMVDILGYDIDESNAFSIVLHSYSYITYSVLGAYFFIFNQYRGNSINSYINYSQTKLEE